MAKKLTSKNTGVSNVVRGKCISLNIKEEGVLEGNVIQIPFIAEYRHKNNPITSIDYEWATNSPEGYKIKRGLEVSGHGRLGVPTLREKEVLRCLHNIFIAQKTKNGVCELKHPDECTADDYAISFTIDGLCKEIGYKSPCNKTRENVRKSLTILVSTTIINRYNGGLYDPEKKQYITNQNIAFHLLESLKEEEWLDNNGNIVEDVTQIRMSDFVYRSLYYNYKLIYSKSRVQSIKHLGAKTLYQLALQWSNNGVAYARIDKLTEHMPMKDGIGIVEKRKYIKRCLNKLSEVEFMDVTIDNNSIVTFKFKDLISEGKSGMIDEMFTTYDEIFEGIRSLGYSKKDAKRLIDERIADLSSVQKALRQAYAIKRQDDDIDEKEVFIQLYFSSNHEQLML